MAEVISYGSPLEPVVASYGPLPLPPALFGSALQRALVEKAEAENVPVVATWLRVFPFASHQTVRLLFAAACRDKATETAKWLFDQEGIDVHVNGSFLLQSACWFGSVHFVKWLLKAAERRGHRLDIHADNDVAFRFACGHGHLDLAKWLYKRGGVDVTVANNFALRLADRHGFPQVADWLMEIMSG